MGWAVGGGCSCQRQTQAERQEDTERGMGDRGARQTERKRQKDKEGKVGILYVWKWRVTEEQSNGWFSERKKKQRDRD